MSLNSALAAQVPTPICPAMTFGFASGYFTSDCHHVIGPIRAKQLPQVIRRRAEYPRAVEIDHRVPGRRRTGKRRAAIDVPQQRRVRDHLHGVGVPFAAHQEDALGQRGQQIATRRSGLGRRHRDFAQIKRRFAAVPFVIFAVPRHEPPRSLIVVPVDDVELCALHRCVTRPRQIGQILQIRVFRLHARHK